MRFTGDCHITAAASAMARGSDSGAVFSENELYRYLLWRRWSDEGQMAVIGLNPSTADESKDDPTVRRCITFAKDWGYGGLTMLNIFALRSTDPKALYRTEIEPIGPENHKYLTYYTTHAGLVLCAWGAHGSLHGRADDVRQLLWESAPGKTFCLGKTKAGHPKHPLYLAANTKAQAFT